MMKINLASRKQPHLSGESRSRGSSSQGFDIKELPIRKLGLPLLVCIGAYSMLGQFKDDELNKVKTLSSQVAGDANRLQLEVSKIGELEATSRSLDEEQLQIRTKLDTIRKLMTDRVDPPKFLVYLANGVPKDVWLTELQLDKQDLVLKGASLGFNQISDFMKNLNDGTYLADIDLKNSQQSKELGYDIATFELRAKRRQ